MNSLKFTISISLALLFGLNTNAQQMAPVKVNCIDVQGTPLSDEIIMFKSLKSAKIFSGSTNEAGLLEMKLMGGDEYQIMIKGFGEDMDYTKMVIPAIREDQAYGLYTVTVQINPPKQYTLDNVYFETGKATLKSESYTELNELAEFLQRKKKVFIEIGGHTDDVGEDELNMTLSQNRAESVKKYLIGKGVSAARITSKGYGETRPIADNGTEEGRQKNRRTEVKILVQ
jgi:outer membrane protein OmpA-like peptidoglycan-associated protein